MAEATVEGVRAVEALAAAKEMAGTATATRGAEVTEAAAKAAGTFHRCRSSTPRSR